MNNFSGISDVKGRSRVVLFLRQYFSGLQLFIGMSLNVMEMLYYVSGLVPVFVWIVTYEASNFSIIDFYCAAI
jgi:hypothetical protein